LSGYTGNILRVNLTETKTKNQIYNSDTLIKYIGIANLDTQGSF